MVTFIPPLSDTAIEPRADTHAPESEIMRKQILVPLLVLVSACNILSTEPDAKLGDGPPVDFKGACGEAANAPNVAESSGMQPLQTATVNGRPVSDCVVGHSGAIIYGIGLSRTAGSNEYVVTVDGHGPLGMFSGSMNLAFTDEAGQTYSLSLYSSRRSQHTTRYNSDKPNIVKIWWSNQQISVPGQD
ncbi:MAG: hypothetical protein ACYC7F_01485 [Gemmatimonadaceae bacterium]